MTNTVLFAQNNTVVALDIDQRKVDLLNARKSPIQDAEIEEFFATRNLDLVATTDKKAAYAGVDFVIVATPTNYDPEQNFF